MIPFVILTAPRSGSQHLQAVLNQHPDIVCHGEILHPQLQFGVRGHNPTNAELTDAMWAYPPVDPAKPDPKAVGWKLLNSHLCPRPTALPAILERPGLRVVVLRRNGLARLRSEKQALTVRRWSVDSPPGPMPAVELQPDDTLNEIHSTAVWYSEIEKMLASTPHTTVTYTELVDNPQNVSDRIAALLGLPCRPVTETGTYRQEPRPITDTITNLDELRKEFAGTHYEALIPHEAALNPMNIAIGIVAHTRRASQAQQLAAAVAADTMSVDPGTIGPTANHRAVWKACADLGADWTVVLEDDAVPAQDFRQQLAAMLDTAPTPVVSLYLGTGRPPQWQPWALHAVKLATKTDACHIRARRLLHAVGVAIRTDLVEDMLAHTAGTTPIDEAITDWAAGPAAAEISYCFPSLVDHADGPTVTRHRDGAPRTQPRKAWRHGTRDTWTELAVYG